jgi:hypothetical protein
MTLSKTIYLQNKRLNLNKASFRLAWQRQTLQQKWTAGLLALLLSGTAFILLRKTPGSRISTEVIHSFFSVLLIVTRKNLSQSLQTSWDSHSRQEPSGG